LAAPSPAAPEAAVVVEDAPRPLDPPDAADLRWRLLLPLENDALRATKRRLIDLQNQALAAIHADSTGWGVDPAATGDVFAGAVASLVDAAYAAGHAAAGELTGRPAPTPVPGTAPLAALDPGAELSGQLADAHRRAVAAEAGERETGAVVSRVFRAWRTDEAERRLRPIAWTAYHHGVLSGLAMLGVDRVTTVADGRRCAGCAARPSQPWDPAGAAPEGWVMPPAHEGCVATIVPG